MTRQEDDFLGYSPEVAELMRRGLAARFDWPTIDRLIRQEAASEEG